MKIFAIWITKGLFIFVIYIAEWNVCSNLGSKLEIFKPVFSDNKSFNIKESIIIYIAIINDLRNY